MMMFDDRLPSDTSLFEGLDVETLEAMRASCSRVELAANETLQSDGGTEWFNILLGGRVKLMQNDPLSGRSFVTFLLERGDVFDLIPLLDGAPHVTMPVAVERTVLLRVPMAQARHWLEAYPAFNRALLRYMGIQMRKLEEFAGSVIFDDTATRLARIILRHARPAEGDGELLAMEGVSHELLAEMIGSVRSVVTTQLKKLKEEGHIVHSRGRIMVKDLEGLIERYRL
jgi:CRP-like cAMP-binding protein